MLKGIDHRLTPDVLHALASMGHGDIVVVVDRNFPADSVAQSTSVGTLLRMDNLTVPDAVEAILSVVPLDTFVDDFAARMEVVGQPDEVHPIMEEVQARIDAAEGRPRPMISIERFAFYEMAKGAYAVIQTGERRFYGCFAFRAGVIAPDA